MPTYEAIIGGHKVVISLDRDIQEARARVGLPHCDVAAVNCGVKQAVKSDYGDFKSCRWRVAVLDSHDDIVDAHRSDPIKEPLVPLHLIHSRKIALLKHLHRRLLYSWDLTPFHLPVDFPLAFKGGEYMHQHINFVLSWERKCASLKLLAQL